ncbi:hypothetical protein ACET3Z_002191 [Daucus carota]
MEQQVQNCCYSFRSKQLKYKLCWMIRRFILSLEKEHNYLPSILFLGSFHNASSLCLSSHIPSNWNYMKATS